MTGIMNYSTADFNSAANTETILCDILRTDASNMPSVISYKENKSTTTIVTSLLSTFASGTGSPTPISTAASSMTTQSGTAITGGAIFNGLALGDRDAVEGEGDTMD